VSAVLVLEDVGVGPLRGVSLALSPGQTARLTIASHDAKSALFALLAGHRAPESGRVRLFGENLYALPDEARVPLYRRAGFVPEQGGLISNLKAWENLLLPAAYHHGLDAHAAEARVVALWREADPDTTDLRAVMGRLPDRLTAFERRVVALIRALLPQPELLVYDFLSSGLDAATAARLYTLTRRFHGEKPGRVSLYLCADDAASAKLPADVSLRLG
jgi:phospholipid/cholesterol/gamma-HCH transport system ATP-binding protein